MRRLLRIVPLLLIVALSGCSIFGGRVGILWSNLPEFAAYAELFNASQSRYQIEVVYKEDPGLALLEGGRLPDLVIGTRIASIPIVGKFGSLEQVLNRGQVNPTYFYKSLLRAGRFEGRQVLLPVSFDLPIFISSSSGGLGSTSAGSVTLDDVKRAAIEFNKKSTDSFRVMAFSPRWNLNFLYTAADMAGADFHQSPRGELAWNNAKLLDAVNSLRDWISTVDGGAQNDLDFGDRYLYDPPSQLITSGRILAYFLSLSSYLSLPADDRQNLRFDWVGADGHIPALDGVLFAGVPRWAWDKGAAYAFLGWLYRPETQRLLLAAAREEHVHTFGIAGGLSPLVAVNEQELPKYYPPLAGRLPAADSIVFPRSLPNDWQDIKRDVVLPWMEHEILQPANDQKLDERLRSWRLQKPLP